MRTATIFLFVIFLVASHTLLTAQIPDLGQFLPSQENNKALRTAEVLQSLHWQELQQYCKTHTGHYTHEKKDSLIIEYEYVQQGYVSYFTLTSYQGYVLEYNSHTDNSTKESTTAYFDKNLWLEFAHRYLHHLPDSLKLSTQEPQNILKAYYRLLGVQTREEYGWICEYSTVGRATARRRAVIDLLGRKDLLQKLLRYPNIHVQLYAVDALIYTDYRDKQDIEKHKTDTEYVRFIEEHLLTESDWRYIYALRDSKQAVKTCMSGTGSFKMYGKTTAELLSDDAIAQIPEHYKELQELGYLR